MAGLATASLAVTATSCGGGGTSGSFDDTVTVGILHSLSGTMAISESTLVDTEKMAIEEINAAGGVKVGADLNIMKSDTEFMRKGKPWFFTNLSSGIGVEEITQFLESHIPNNRN